MSLQLRSLRFAVLLLSVTGLCACSSGSSSGVSSPDVAEKQEAALGGSDNVDGVSDPLEGVNRTVFSFNEAVDKAVAEPIARGYRAVTPKGIRKAVTNFVRNLKSPITAGNQLLQGDVEGTVNAVARAVINTLAGFGGILDVAGEGGIEYEPEDFGQTLAVWGVGSGPYIVLPFLGPSNLRDATGMVVDSYADPLRMYLFNTDNEEWHYGRLGVSALEKREGLLDIVDDLRKNSFDYYASVRSAYHQHRQELINDGEYSLSAVPDIPDYDDF